MKKQKQRMITSTQRMITNAFFPAFNGNVNRAMEAGWCFVPGSFYQFTEEQTTHFTVVLQRSAQDSTEAVSQEKEMTS